MLIQQIRNAAVKIRYSNLPGQDSYCISANREGLLSLAKHLTALADGEPGEHVHYDEFNSLEEGSTEIIIERTR